jgi:hypothetical protein
VARAQSQALKNSRVFCPNAMRAKAVLPRHATQRAA